MKTLVPLTFSLIVGLFLSVAHAQDAPTITVKKGDAINVALGAITGPDAAGVSKVLENDFAIAGSVNLTEAGRASYVINAEAQSGGIQGRVLDRSGATILSKTYPGGRQGVHRFVDDVVETLTGKPGIASSKIAFVSSRSGRKEIYLCDYDGANTSQLTQDNSISVGPNLSPGAKFLSYTGYKSGYADLYVINLGAGSRNRVVKFPGTNTGGAFSPDGSRMAVIVSKDGNPELYTIGTNGSGAKRLTKTRGVESSPTWSPDGASIIYSSDDRGGPQLYKISASGGRAELVSTGYAYCTEPNWSPDGTKVAFNIREGGVFKVAVLDLQRGGVRVITSGSDAEDPSWGANSRHLIYVQGNSIHLHDSQTGKSVKVVSGMGRISEPSWSR
jgi:TolB protein